MRELKFLAGLGTILVFIGIYCFKGLYQQKIVREEVEEESNAAGNNRNKILLILTGSISIIGGLLLIGLALRKTL